MPIFKARRIARPVRPAPGAAIRPSLAARPTAVPKWRALAAGAGARRGRKKMGFARGALMKMSEQARMRVVQEVRNPIREAGRLEARLKLAMSQGNYEEAKRVFYEMMGNMEILSQYAEALGKNSHSAMVLERQVSLLNRTQEELVRRKIIQ